MYEHLIRPSRTYYVLPIGSFILGMALFVLVLLENLNSLGDDLSQYVVPGSHKTELTEIGTHTIFYEFTSVVQNEVYSTPQNLPGLKVRLVSPSGDEVQLRRPSTGGTYSLGGRSGFAVLEFEVQQPGSYQLSAGYGSGVDGPRVVLALGHNFMSRLFRTIITCILIAFSSLAVAVTIAIVIWRKRKKSKELLISKF